MIESNIYLEMILHTNLDLTPVLIFSGFRGEQNGRDFNSFDEK